MRNDPLAPPTLALAPPPGAPGQPYPGLRDKQTGPGAGGVDPEDLAAAVGQWSTEAMSPAKKLHPGGRVSTEYIYIYIHNIWRYGYFVTSFVCVLTDLLFEGGGILGGGQGGILRMVCGFCGFEACRGEVEL